MKCELSLPLAALPALLYVVSSITVKPAAPVSYTGH